MVQFVDASYYIFFSLGVYQASTFLQNGNTNALNAEGMNGPEVAQRLKQLVGVSIYLYIFPLVFQCSYLNE